MSKLELQIFPKDVLKEKTLKIKEPLSEEIQTLIKEMFEIMRAKNGVGLAAPQVGKSLRLCVIEVDGIEYVLINPTITAKSKTKVTSEEGCLSFPGQFFPIKRHEKVQVRYLDKNGKNAKIKGDGLLAIALQHEIDHLDGVLIIDRVKKINKK
jgi:peptide deformylase